MNYFVYIVKNFYSVIFLIAFIFLSGILLMRYFESYAMKNQILALPGKRTLHENDTPRGGGIIFSLLFIFSIGVLFLLDIFSSKVIIVLGVGGLVATLFGFFDDIYDIEAKKKLVIQIIISWLSLFMIDGWLFTNVAWFPSFIIIPFSILVFVWMLNAYNFMDGIDGLAASGAFFGSGVLALIMIINNGPLELLFLSILLMSCIGSFLVFNWPPATIFMGDSGSIFLGYIFGVLIIYTTVNNLVSIWTWFIIFGYFFADTSVTMITRLIFVKKWYFPHRSHAYQNLSRITNSHLKITGSILIYNLLWILPLSIWSVMDPNKAVFALLLAIIPSVVVCFKYGPILSSE